MCSSSGGSSEPDNSWEKAGTLTGQLYDSVYSRDGDALDCSDESVCLCVC